MRETDHTITLDSGNVVYKSDILIYFGERSSEPEQTTPTSPKTKNNSQSNDLDDRRASNLEDPRKRAALLEPKATPQDVPNSGFKDRDEAVKKTGSVYNPFF